jgi:Bacterial regulatory helix-turn-helix protein, lysR family
VSIRRPKSEVNMGLDLPPFNGLRLFEAAARCGSFKRAAQELNLTSGASHGIASLEEWLGVELFDRSRGLALTPAGHRYLPYVKEGSIDDRERHKRNPCQEWRRVRRSRGCRRFYHANRTPD